MRRSVHHSLTGLLILVLSATLLALPIFADDPVPSDTDPSDPILMVPGTTLTASKTAAGYTNSRTEYDWTITQSVSPASLIIARGQTGSATFTLTATRTQVGGGGGGAGVTGEICVTNAGERVTENLAITDVIQTKVGSGQYQDYLSV